MRAATSVRAPATPVKDVRAGHAGTAQRVRGQAMQTIDCTDPSLNLVLPPCAAVPSAARLTRRGFEDVPVTASVEDRVVTLAAVPAALTRGVWTLAIDSECGCYTASVFVDICTPPAFQAEHIGEEREPIPVCCPEEDDLCAS